MMQFKSNSLDGNQYDVIKFKHNVKLESTGFFKDSSMNEEKYLRKINKVLLNIIITKKPKTMAQ